MDGILQIGPLAIATDRALTVSAIWAFVAIAGIIATRIDSGAARASWITVLIGVVAARVGYILANLDAFLVDPWSMLAIWQGGFSPWPGLVAAAITIIMMLGRKPVGMTMLATLSIIALAHAGAAGLLAPDRRPMPQLALANLQGTKTKLGAAGEPMVVNLWATWCPPCRREMPMLIEVAHEAEIPVLLANQGEDQETIRAFLMQQGLAGNSILADPDATLGQAIASPALPTTLFVNPAGDIVDIHAGEISRAALTSAIRDLHRSQ
ncbi:TlpA disulfide reductase family protein [Pacificimonas flava]|uniref:Redoxin domain protein n=1 Tax=Pacificimonas flava TaxID=1234595 RepID=M2T5U8_9SPHN|nr:TlpA disulfide reductase family protein [Pacificimonas flava]EMD81839.1 Redoxin domain protein [Pacificimonas flava]MBB5281631.1 thiol-disulfide isomerase/thioredoxin [Pacificimonas flava]